MEHQICNTMSTDWMNTKDSVWNFFDRIYCISLVSREDRRRAAAKAFASVGLQDKVEFVLVQPLPANIEQGMYESHMTCLRKGLQAGAHHILVFEDDVTFDGFDEENFREGLKFLLDHPSWKVLLLGALICSSRKTTNPHIQRVRYQSLAHAYAVNRPYAETLAYQPWQGIVIDEIFRPLRDGIYAIYPMFAFQNDFPSDNDPKYKRLERFRSLCGGLKRIQQLNEFYHRHKASIILVHLLLFFLLLLVFLQR